MVGDFVHFDQVLGVAKYEDVQTSLKFEEASIQLSDSSFEYSTKIAFCTNYEYCIYIFKFLFNSLTKMISFHFAFCLPRPS